MRGEENKEKAISRHTLSIRKKVIEENSYFTDAGLQGDGREQNPENWSRLPEPTGAQAEGQHQAKRKNFSLISFLQCDSTF